MTTNKNEKITVLTREEMFAKNCKIFDLRREYPGYDGEVFWAIATSYTNADLHAFYSDLIKPYEPFMQLSAKEGQAFRDFTNNEDKHQKRRMRSVDIFGYDDEQSPQFHGELCSFDEYFSENEGKKQEYQLDVQLAFLRKGVAQLSEIQRRRLKAFYFEGKTSRAIAKEEDINYSAVDKSISQALKKIKNYFQKMGVQNPTFVQMSEGVNSYSE